MSVTVLRALLLTAGPGSQHPERRPCGRPLLPRREPDQLGILWARFPSEPATNKAVRIAHFLTGAARGVGGFFRRLKHGKELQWMNL
jgi:hypothetical protein